MRLAILFFCFFAASAGFAGGSRCHPQEYYDSLDEKPLTYWVYSPSLQKCIFVLSGQGFNGSGRGGGGSNGQGSGGSGGSGDGNLGNSYEKGQGGQGDSEGSGVSSAGTFMPMNPSAETPTYNFPVVTTPVRSVADGESRFEVIYDTKTTKLPIPPPSVPSKAPTPDKLPIEDEEPSQKNPQAPDLT